MSDEDYETGTPPQLRKIAEETIGNLLPDKSKCRYHNQYNRFIEWCHKNSVNNFSENVLLAYFTELAMKIKSSTLWSTYSMLKSTLLANKNHRLTIINTSLCKNVDIAKYAKLHAFLTRKSEDYVAKKAGTFNRKDINKFLEEAPDQVFLMMKVTLVVGVAGAMKCDKLLKLSTNDVIDKGDVMVIKIPNIKTKIARTFVITQDISARVNALQLIRKYRSLRPKCVPHSRFFIFYGSGKCSTQPVGINTFSKIPTKIATFLKLENCSIYTGHTFRRTSASLLVEEGGDLLALKRHGGWKSSSVAEGYVDNSIANKTNTAHLILHGKDLPSTSTSTNAVERNQSSLIKTNMKNAENCINMSNFNTVTNNNENVPPSLTLNNCSNCPVNINYIYNK